MRPLYVYPSLPEPPDVTPGALVLLDYLRSQGIEVIELEASELIDLRPFDVVYLWPHGVRKARFLSNMGVSTIYHAQDSSTLTYFVPSDHVLDEQVYYPYVTTLLVYSRYHQFHLEKSLLIESTVLPLPVLTPSLSGLEHRLDRVLIPGRFDPDRQPALLLRFIRWAREQNELVTCKFIFCTYFSMDMIDEADWWKFHEDSVLLTSVTRSSYLNAAATSKVCLHAGLEDTFGLSIAEGAKMGAFQVYPNMGPYSEYIGGGAYTPFSFPEILARIKEGLSGAKNSLFLPPDESYARAIKALLTEHA